MATGLHPTLVQHVGDELAIVWSDGGESFLNLERLRRACPCAGCGGEPDILGNIDRPQLTYTPSSFVLRSFQQIGGYALQPSWADGHSTGIYSYPFLQRLAGQA